MEGPGPRKPGRVLNDTLKAETTVPSETGAVAMRSVGRLLCGAPTRRVFGLPLRPGFGRRARRGEGLFHEGKPEAVLDQSYEFVCLHVDGLHHVWHFRIAPQDCSRVTSDVGEWRHVRAQTSRRASTGVGRPIVGSAARGQSYVMAVACRSSSTFGFTTLMGLPAA